MVVLDICWMSCNHKTNLPAAEPLVDVERGRETSAELMVGVKYGRISRSDRKMRPKSQWARKWPVYMCERGAVPN